MAISWPRRASLTRGGLCWRESGWGDGYRAQGCPASLCPLWSDPRYLEKRNNPSHGLLLLWTSLFVFFFPTTLSSLFLVASVETLP